MNKEEILAKSRKENVLQDEMERTVRIEGESFSLILVFLVGVVIVIFNRLHGLPANSVLAMFWALERSKPVAASLIFALGCLTKLQMCYFAPVLLLGFLLLRLRPARLPPGRSPCAAGLFRHGLGPPALHRPQQPGPDGHVLL